MAEHRRACASCGTANDEDARFCEGCGASCAGLRVLRGGGRATARFCRAAADHSTPVGTGHNRSRACPQDGDRHVRRPGRFDQLRGAGRRRDGARGDRRLPRPPPLDRTAHRAGVIRVIGDGLMAVWGVPETGPDDAGHAVVAGVELQDRFIDFAARVPNTWCRSRPAGRGEHR